jgi:protein transport protein SEC24
LFIFIHFFSPCRNKQTNKQTNKKTSITGGQLYFYARWKALRDAAKLEADIFRNVTRFTGFDILMKVRCSKGIAPNIYYGKLVMKSDAAQIAAMDADKSVVVDFVYDDNLDERQEHCIQSAVLYVNF